MSKIIEILGILDKFFQKGPEGLSIYDDDSINPHLEKIYQFMDEKTSQKLKNHIRKAETTSPEEPSIKEFAGIFSDTIGSLEIPAILEFMQNFVKSAKDNLASVFYLSDMFEKDLYEKINPILNYLSTTYSEQFMNASVWLLSTQANLSSYTQETESIMLIHDELVSLEENIEDLKLSDLVSFPDKLGSKINRLGEDKFMLYFKDWVLKFSLLIESKFKAVLIFLNYFSKLEKKEKVKLQKLRRKMLGKICTDLDIQKNYPNIDRFRIYRNKMFHANIGFTYDEKWEKRRIVLRKDLDVSMAEFIIDFGKIFRFLNTFLTMVNLIAITFEVNGKSSFDRYVDQLDKTISNYRKKTNQN